MKKFTVLLLIAAIVCGLFAGCGKKADEDAYVPTGNALVMEGEEPDDFLEEEEVRQELTLAYFPDRSMNPLIGVNISNRLVMSLLYQGLFATNSKDVTYPILCSSWRVTPNNMNYTVYLDERATFSDGTPVTAEDVVATYAAAKEEGYYAGRFTHIVNVEATDDGGVLFQTDTPYQNLPLLLDIPILKASEVAADNPLGSGPYIFSEGLGGVHLRKDMDWWCQKKLTVFADSITLVEAADQGQIRDEFQFGDVGLATANPMSDSFEEYRCDYELWDVETGVFLYLGVNVTFSDYFNKEDKTLRKALTYAIDRQKLIEENYHGLAHAATLAVSPASPYYNENMASKYHYDPMKFIELLSSWAPLKDKDTHEDKKLVLLVNSDDSARLRTARDISATLNELGVPCGTLEYGNSTNPTYEVVLRANNWDLVLGQTKLPPNYDLSEFFRPWGELNWGGITNNTLYSQCLLALDNSGNYYNLLKDVQETSSIIPILFGYNTVYAERGLFDNLTPARDNIFFYTLGKTMEGTQLETIYN